MEVSSVAKFEAEDDSDELGDTISTVEISRSADPSLRPRTLPNEGRTGRGFITSSMSSSAGIGSRWPPFDLLSHPFFPESLCWGLAKRGALLGVISAAVPTISGSASKLTRADFFFCDLGPNPSAEAMETLSEVSLDA